MSFQFKFPRRVRIHGGECGAVARALHHEAQKNALIPYEQVTSSLISDEKASMRQAGSGKCLDSTLNERKQMSTKTSIKRIALVAVSALGFGLLSVMPAKAAADSVTADATALLSGQTVTLTVTDATLNASDTAATLAPTVATSGTATLGSVTTVKTGATTFTVAFTVTRAATASETITVTYDEDNTAGAPRTDDTGTIRLTVVNGTFTSIANAGPVRAGSSQAVNVMVAGTGTIVVDSDDNSAADNTDNPLVYVNTSKPATSTVTYTAIADGTKTLTSTTQSLGTIAVDVEGTYNGYLFWDANESGALDANEPSITYNFSTSGVPAAITLAGTANSVGVNADNEYTVTFTNSSGALTQSKATEFVTISAVGTGTVTLTGGSDSTSLTSATSGTTATATIAFGQFADGTAKFKVKSNAGSDSVAITVTPSVVLAAQGATAKTATMTTIAAQSSTTIDSSVTLGSNIRLATAGAATGVTTNAYQAAPTVGSFTFNLSGLTPNTSVQPTIAITDTGSDMTVTVDGVAYTSGTALPRTTSATGTVTLSVAVSGTRDNNDALALDINGGTGDVTNQRNSTVTFVTIAYSNAITTPAVATTLQETGSTVTVAGTTRDQFGNPATGNLITVTSSVTGGTTRTGTAVVAADGTWSVTLAAVDAATTQLVATVTATGAISAPNTPTATFNFTANGLPTAITLVAGTNAGAAVGDQVNDDKVPYLIPATDGVMNSEIVDDTWDISAAAASNGANTTADSNDHIRLVTTSTLAGAFITLTGSSGVLLKATNAPTTAFDGANSITIQAGTAVYAWSNTTGLKTVTATAGALTVSRQFYVGPSPLTGARNIAISGATSLTNSQVSTYTVTVTDAFGNPVAGYGVPISVVGLGFINGSLTSATTANTGAAGTATFQLVAANAGAGTITVTATGANNQFGAAAGAATGTTAGTNGFGASTSPASLAISVASAESVTLTTVNATATEAKTEAAAATAAATAAGTKADAAKTEAAAATAAATAAGTKADAAKDAATTAGTKADAAKTEAAAATAAATAAGTKADAAKDAATKAGTDAVAAADAAKAEAAKATAASAANAVEIAKILAAVTALNANTSAADAYDAALEAIDAANAATDAAGLAAEAADAATVAAEEARDAADAATAAVEELATQVSTLLAAMRAQLTTLANTIAKIAKKVKA